ncbi:MAG: hypothetical protein ACREJ0_28435 [Geminicoccaceae bacterium]
MDSLNNAVAATAPELSTWGEVLQWARGKVDEAARHNGDGQDGRLYWHRKQPSNWRADFTDVPITPIEKGGPEHRYDADEEQAESIAPPEAASADPLERPVESWSEEDIRAVLNSPAYLRSQHADHERAQRLVRRWFEQRFGTGPARVDATGRTIPRVEAKIDASAGGCPVEVRAHTRDGGKIEVRKHCRSSPAAA